MKNMFKEFLSNFKEYIDYLMKVDFRELFINTLILICLLILSAFFFIPIGIIQDVIRSFIIIFVDFNVITGSLYNWLFYLLSFVVCIYAFVYMFNKRFGDLEELKKQIKNKDVKKVVNTKEKDDELELPKAKNNK